MQQRLDGRSWLVRAAWLASRIPRLLGITAPHHAEASLTHGPLRASIAFDGVVLTIRILLRMFREESEGKYTRMRLPPRGKYFRSQTMLASIPMLTMFIGCTAQAASTASGLCLKKLTKRLTFKADPGNRTPVEARQYCEI
jgi:hypothetical protein